MASCNNTSKEPVSRKIKTEKTQNLSSFYPELGINKNIERSRTNLKIIKKLEGFFRIKNTEPRSFEYWKESDFEKYMFPYQDVMNLEKSFNIEGAFYQPTVLEIVNIGDEEKIIKVAFIGNENEKNFLKAVYNLIIDTTDWKFKRVLEYNTQDWEVYQTGNIQYVNSPLRKFDYNNAKEFNDLNNTLAEFFKRPPSKITYYSCTTPAEFYRIMGYDYIPNMYIAQTGALNEYTSNIIFSGNNSEYYAHELVHSYLSPEYHKSLPSLQILSEGFATYIGGSNEKTFEELRNELQVLISKTDVDLLEYLNPYYETQHKNQISYTIGALLCERAIRMKGAEGFKEIFKKENLEASLNFIDINSENLNKELQAELNRVHIPPSSILD